MRKIALLFILLSLAGVASCGDGLPVPTTVNSSTPSSTSTSTSASDPTVEPTTVPTESGSEPLTPAGEAKCVADPMDFPTVENIPPLTEEDYVIGPSDAPITFIEYADFQ